MFLHTLRYKLLDTLTMLQRQRVVVINTLFLMITIHLSTGVYIPPEDQTTPAPGTGGTISSVLAHPPTTQRSNNKEHSGSNLSPTSPPILDYISDEGESAAYYEYENVNQTNDPEASGGNNNDDGYCSFTLYVSQNSEKNSDGCRVQSSGDIKTQRGIKGKVISGRPRTSEFLRRRLASVERRLDLVERQFYRQSDTLEKMQNQILGSEEGGLCDSGWVNHGNSCYWFGSHHVSWDAARVICRAKGANADLAVPSDDSEAKLLASYAEYYDPHYSWWLGCSQFEVGDWRCVNGQPMNYTNWRIDRPSNYENQRCLQLGRPPKVEFVDTQCNQKWPFACEKPTRRSKQST